MVGDRLVLVHCGATVTWQLWCLEGELLLDRITYTWYGDEVGTVETKLTTIGLDGV